MRKLLIVLTAIAFVAAFTVPAIAAEWGFYGSARMYTFMSDYSEEYTGTGFSDDDLSWFLQGNARIGARVKAGNISGRFEYGNFSLRLLYGEWDFGTGKLLVGQAYSPIDTFISNQMGPGHWGGDIDALPWGGIYDGRVAQIKLKMGGFQVALIQPKVVSAMDLVPDDTDTSIPKIEASYSFSAGPVSLKVLGGMNSHDDVVITGTTEKAYGIDSSVFGVMAKFATGPFSIAGNFFMATNPGNFGLLQDIPIKSAIFIDNVVEDCDSQGALIVLGFKLSDTIKFEAGYGMLANEVSHAGVTAEAETTSYYVQATIDLAKGFFIVPEFGSVDYGDFKFTGDPDEKLGDVNYYGLKWQINF